MLCRIPALATFLQGRPFPRPPEWARSWLPAFSVEGGFWGIALWQWLFILGIGVAAALLGVLFGSVLVRVSGRVAKTTTTDWDDRLIKCVRGPTRFLIGTGLFLFGIEFLELAREPREAIGRTARIVSTFAIAWLAVRMVRLALTVMQERAEAKAEEEGDLIQARGIRTRLLVLQRVLSIAIWVLAVALVLMQFEVVRSVGVSLLASAGVAGIVLGLAAQKTIGNLLGGIQLSVTQPIRIGDTVIVEGEWGQIEEINLTYIVVRIWDQRRLVVPTSKFLEEPFQNWTKKETELLGTVFLHADYRLPVQAARDHLAGLLESEEKYDGRAHGLVVTDVTERTIQLRCMVSAADASSAWELRCSVREKMVAWLNEYEGGRYLPLLRVEGDSERDPSAGASPAPGDTPGAKASAKEAS